MRNVCWLIAVLSTVAACGQDLKPAVTAAVAKVGDAGSYSWKRVTDDTAAGGGTFVETGKTDASGYAVLELNSGDLFVRVVLRGGNGVIDAGEGWKSMDDLAGQRRAARAMARVVRGFRSPLLVARELLSRVKTVGRDADAAAVELDGKDATDVLGPVFGLPGGAMTDAKVTAKFWERNGVLTRYELQAEGTMSRGGTDTDVRRTIGVDFSDVGSTKLEVPDEAKKKLE